MIASLRRHEAEEAVRDLRAQTGTHAELDGAWGDLFTPDALKERTRTEILADASARQLMVDDLFGPLTEEVFERSTLGRLLLDVQPTVVVDCVNTAGALAYQDVFASAKELRVLAADGQVDVTAVDRHLSTMYLPKLIRHTQIALEGMKRAGTRVYVKIGTSGTGGMGLNIPFTHSEERPSRVLLAKAGLAGAQTILLYLMARTAGSPSDTDPSTGVDGRPCVRTAPRPSPFRRRSAPPAKRPSRGWTSPWRASTWTRARTGSSRCTSSRR